MDCNNPLLLLIFGVIFSTLWTFSNRSWGLRRVWRHTFILVQNQGVPLRISRNRVTNSCILCCQFCTKCTGGGSTVLWYYCVGGWLVGFFYCSNKQDLFPYWEHVQENKSLLHVDRNWGFQVGHSPVQLERKRTLSFQTVRQRVEPKRFQSQHFILWKIKGVKRGVWKGLQTFFCFVSQFLW